MMNRRRWSLLTGLVLLVAAFLLVNFRAAASNTQSGTNISTASIGEGLPYAMQRREKITIAVTGNGPLVGALQKALTVEMQSAGLGEVELVERVQEPGTKYSNPFLLVDVGQPGVIWTPFYGTSQFKVLAGYVSNGDAGVLGEKPILLDNKDGPALNMSAEYNINDHSWGILSRPGYYQVLADWLARSIVEETRKLYEPKF